MQNPIRAAVKLEDTRNTIKKFFAEKYSESVNPYIDNVKAIMEKEKVQAIPALLKISKMKHYQDDGMVQALYVSATYEIIVNEKAEIKS